MTEKVEESENGVGVGITIGKAMVMALAMTGLLEGGLSGGFLPMPELLNWGANGNSHC